MYYHASSIGGITRLEPRISNHGIPLIYFSQKRENVLVYLCNAIEKFCKETGLSKTAATEKILNQYLSDYLKRPEDDRRLFK